MEITVNNTQVILEKKERFIGGEAPAVLIKMLNGESKVIGMMADKVQVMITLPYKDSFSDSLKTIIEKYQEKAFIYLISSEPLKNSFNKETSSVDFYEFSLKFGVNVDKTLCAKSIFIINKDGEFVYKEIVPNLVDEFELANFDDALNKAIKFRKKGHVHENWMGV
jgi:thiol peroxidase